MYFYSKILGFLNEEQIKEYLLKDIPKDLIWMINENWNILKKELIEQNVSEIQIFFNLIFPKLSEKINNTGNFNTPELRINFENSINSLVEEVINNYANLSEKYKQFNKSILGHKDNLIKLILQERIDLRKIDSRNYILIKYFTVPKYPSKEDFWEKIQLVNKNQVPVINS